MNRQRRAAIDDLVAKLEEIRDDFIELASEERDAFDNMPDGIAESERGLAMEEAADKLSTISDDLEAMIETCNEAKGE